MLQNHKLPLVANTVLVEAHRPKLVMRVWDTRRVFKHVRNLQQQGPCQSKEGCAVEYSLRRALSVS